MIRVLTFAPSIGDGTSFYRLGGVIPFLEKEYSDIKIKDLSKNNSFDWHDYVSYDIAIFQRPFIAEHLSVIKMLKTMGIKVIIDYDDDVLNLPIHNPHYANYKSNERNIKSIASIADEIWVSTSGLQKTFDKYNKNIKVIPNAHNDYIFPVNKKRDFKFNNKKIAYRGGTTHEVDVYSKIDEWKEIINENIKYDFYFMGSRFPYLESLCGDNYLIVPGMHIIEYFDYFSKLNPSLFIYTLEDTKFNRGKSNISWIEATYAGSAVLAPVYLDEFVKPGIINFEVGLKDVFNNIKSNDKTLKESNELSWDYIKTNLLLSFVNQERYNSIKFLKNIK